MSTSCRFPAGANQDITLRTGTVDFQTPAYAATITLTPTQYITLVQPAALTGACTINVGVGSSTTAPYVGDILKLVLVSDGTTRTVTIGTGAYGTASTFAVTTGKYGYLEFVFNGTYWQETARAITA